MTGPRVVYKYPIEPGRNVITARQGARWLHVAVQHGQPCVWAEVNPHAPEEQVTLNAVSTGRAAPPHGLYVGTFLLDGGALVFHLYAQPGAGVTL